MLCFAASSCLIGECGGKYVGFCVSSKLEARFSRRVAESDVSFAERCSYLDAVGVY